jgi:branched-subunit amino acid aminotransferase/4-amino-4-deoxychorismate lyase
MLAALLNGQAIAPQQSAIHLDDRGLLYGDGLFETMLLRDGGVRFIDDHVIRLQQGCERLKISSPDSTQLQDELRQLTQQHQIGRASCRERVYRHV